MAKGVNIPIAADARSVISEGKRVEGALDDVIDSLDDVGKSSTDAGRDLDRSTSDMTRSLDGVSRQARETGGDLEHEVSTGAKAAADQADPLERTFREALDTVSKESRQAGDDLGRHVKAGAQEASEGTDALKENAGANAKEVAASFDGSAQSIADGFQGLAAEAFEGFGPAGLVAGTAAAAGLGLVTNALQKSKEEAQATAEEVADVASALLDIGSTNLDDAHVDDTLKDWATSAEDGSVKLDKLADRAKAAGIDFHDFARGVAGDTAAGRRSFDEVNAGLSAYYDGLYKVQQRYGFVSAAAQGYVADHHDELTALTDARKALLEQDATLDQAAGTYAEYMDATRGSTAATKDDTKATDANTTAQDDNTDSQRAAIDARRSLFDATTNLNAVVAQSTDTLKKNRSAGLTPTTAAGRENRQALSDMASAYEAAADAITEAGGSQDKATKKIRDGRAAVIDAAESLGYTRAQAKKYADQLGLIPARVTSTVTVSTPDKKLDGTKARLDAIAAATATVEVKADTTSFDRTLKKLSNGTYQVYVNGVPAGRMLY